MLFQYTPVRPGRKSTVKRPQQTTVIGGVEIAATLKLEDEVRNESCKALFALYRILCLDGPKAPCLCLYPGLNYIMCKLQEKRSIFYQRRGATFALTSIVKLCGADLMTTIPALWDNVNVISKHKDVLDAPTGT